MKYYQHYKQVEQDLRDSRTTLREVVEKFHVAKARLFGREKFVEHADTALNRHYDALFQFLYPNYRTR